MKLKLFSFIVAIFVTTAWSQNNSASDYSISINGHKIQTVANFAQQAKQLKSSAVGKQSNKSTYNLLQFATIPTADELKKLSSQGVNVISYFSNNAYYVAIAPKFYTQRSFSKNIRTLVAVDSNFKIDPVIANGETPDYAKVGNNLKVVITYFKGVDSTSISEDLSVLGLKKYKNLDSFTQIYAQVSENKIAEIAKSNWVQNIELIGPPVESDNVPGVTSHKANILNSSIPNLGYNLTGKGVKVGIWDGNLEQHVDHTGRVINREYETPSSHGSHVSGTIGGAGILDPRARGMAPEAQLFGWNFNTQSNGLPVHAERELAFVNDDVDLTSNSYGINLTTGFNTLRYGLNDRGDDDVTVKYPSLLNVYSNGNAQTAFPGGFNTSTKASKNALHVAANDPDDFISTYSSFGPTIDGRLVPQIAAVGSNVYSLDYNNSYQVMSGTSMSTPGVSGTVALLYERYKNIYGEKPLASLMKALVSNTAKDVGNPGPDYKYGFGNMNGLRAVKVLDKKMFYSASVSNGASSETDIVVPAGLMSLKVMLAYSDIGAVVGATDIQVNNLDIRIVRNGVTTLPWILNPMTPNADATRGVDNLNNIEQITIDRPEAGTYKIIVRGTTVPLNSQEFAVVYDYVTPELVLTYPIGGEKFNPNSTEFIRWDYEGEDRRFNIEFSADGGNNYTLIASDVPSAARNFAWTVPVGLVQNAKIRISAGTNVDVSTRNFSIMSEPRNLVISVPGCGGTSYKMDWDAIPGAKYEVLRLNSFQFDLVATVTSPTFTFTNLPVGTNNWFTVRAVDIATGVVSERARAVNVEPISRPVLTALSLPFRENFNDRKPLNYTLSRASATGSIGFFALDQNFLDAVRMSGASAPAGPLWVASTVANAFTNNPNYIKRLSFCEIDASSLSGRAIRMSFNLFWNNGVAANKNFFRVLVNGVPVPSNENILVYGGSSTSGNIRLTYNLAAVAGTNFTVTLEGLMDNDNTGGNSPIFNTISIDNVEIFEATQTDVALSQLTTNTTFTATETIIARVFNFSPVAVSNVPVSYTINGGTAVNEIIPGPIAPLSDIVYSFTRRADFSALGIYTVAATVNFAGDAVATNNTISQTVFNVGTDVLMGSTSPNVTCAAVFTDSGSRFGNYTNNLNQTMTFRPATAGNGIKVDFTEFATEAGFDFLRVFNGPTTASPLLGTFDGNRLPPSMTSTATTGELTFSFTSDVTDVDKGWIANISCVARPIIVADHAIVSIITPETLGRKTSTNNITIRVTNLGPTASTNVPVFYQIGTNPKVTELIPSIAIGASVNFTFTTKADLSVANATYSVNAGIDVIDDNVANNTLVKVVFNRNALPVNTNTNGFAISRFRWNEVINNSGTTAYSDFKNIRIPVYAGFTYQPEVTISKPERPLTRDLTSIPGVFTMIVIDLNGDGNLTDEFYDGNYWVNTLNTSAAPAIPSTTSVHYFRNQFNLVGGLTIPAGTTSGDKLMRVIHMFRSPNELFNVVLGPTIDGLTTSRSDFEIEEYTINVLPFTAANASIESVSAPVKPGNRPVVVSAVIRNFSNGPISNFPVAYTINGGPEVVQNQVTAIPAGGTATITFATRANLGIAGTYVIQVATKLAGDTDATNDARLTTLTHVVDAVNNVTGTFDGGNDYVAVDASPLVDLTNSYTIEAWVNRQRPTIFGRIFDKSRVNLFVHTNNNSIYTENSLVLSITTAAGTYVLNTGLNTVQLNKWYHIAVSVSATNVYTIYIDGVVAPFTATGVAAPATTNATLPAFIGGNPTATRGFAGNIDEVRVWTGVRTQAEIVANAMTKFVGTEAGLLAYYSFAEGSDRFVFDSTANDNTATVLLADTDGIGAGKFWNTPVLLQEFQLADQLSASYDAATRTYTVLLRDGVSRTTARPIFTIGMNSIAKIGTVTQVSGVTPNDFTNPVTFTVEGVGFNQGITETYTARVLSGLSNESRLLSYDFRPTINPSLVQEVKTIIFGSNAFAAVPFGINVSRLRAHFAISPRAELFINNVPQSNLVTTEFDYSNSVLVTVVSENKLSRTSYMVTVDSKNNEANFISYSLQNQVGSTTLDAVSRSVRVMVNNNANLSRLIPSFNLSTLATARIGTYLQNSGLTSLNYVAPTTYNIVAQTGNTNNWLVTVERAKPVITLLGNRAMSIPSGCAFVEPGFSATDNLNNNITGAVLVSGNVNVNVAGQYILTYGVRDALNNEFSITRTVTVTSVICTLGIADNQVEGFTISPNPVKDGKFFVSASSSSIKNIKIFDVVGKQVLSTQTLSKEVNVSKFRKGVYFVKMEQDGKTAVQKLIIQ